jgi:tape measure domain-containing protein
MALGSGGNLGTLSLHIEADTRDFDTKILQVEKRAAEAGRRMSKSLGGELFKGLDSPLSVNVDHTSLKELNAHLDLKRKHLHQVIEDFKRNPIVAKYKVEGKEALENSSETLKALSNKQVGVSVLGTGKALGEMEAIASKDLSQTARIDIEIHGEKDLDRILRKMQRLQDRSIRVNVTSANYEDISAPIISAGIKKTGLVPDNSPQERALLKAIEKVGGKEQNAPLSAGGQEMKTAVSQALRENQQSFGSQAAATVVSTLVERTVGLALEEGFSRVMLIISNVIKDKLRFLDYIGLKGLRQELEKTVTKNYRQVAYTEQGRIGGFRGLARDVRKVATLPAKMLAAPASQVIGGFYGGIGQAYASAFARGSMNKFQERTGKSVEEVGEKASGGLAGRFTGTNIAEGLVSRAGTIKGAQDFIEPRLRTAALGRAVQTVDPTGQIEKVLQPILKRYGVRLNTEPLRNADPEPITNSIKKISQALKQNDIQRDVANFTRSILTLGKVIKTTQQNVNQATTPEERSSRRGQADAARAEQIVEILGNLETTARNATEPIISNYKKEVAAAAKALGVELSNIKIDPDKQLGQDIKNVAIVSGGFAGMQGEAGQRQAPMYEQILGDGTKVVPFNNEDFDTSVKAQDDKPAWVRDIAGLFARNISKGYNPASIKMAQQAAEYKLTNPAVDLQLIGHSAGGIIVKEAQAMLKEIGIEAKAIALGSPNIRDAAFNGTDSNFLSFMAEKDMLNPLSGETTPRIPGIENHSIDEYLSNQAVQAVLKTVSKVGITPRLIEILNKTGTEFSDLTTLTQALEDHLREFTGSLDNATQEVANQNIAPLQTPETDPKQAALKARVLLLARKSQQIIPNFNPANYGNAASAASTNRQQALQALESVKGFDFNQQLSTQTSNELRKAIRNLQSFLKRAGQEDNNNSITELEQLPLDELSTLIETNVAAVNSIAANYQSSAQQIDDLKARLGSLTVKDLREIGGKANIPNLSQLNKDPLINKLTEPQNAFNVAKFASEKELLKSIRNAEKKATQALQTAQKLSGDEKLKLLAEIRQSIEAQIRNIDANSERVTDSGYRQRLGATKGRLGQSYRRTFDVSSVEIDTTRQSLQNAIDQGGATPGLSAAYTTPPKNFQRLVANAAQAAGVELNEKNQPELVEDDIKLLALGSKAFYDFTKNQVIVSRRTAQALKSSVTDLHKYEEELGEAIHEIQHAADLGFSKLDPTNFGSQIIEKSANIPTIEDSQLTKKLLKQVEGSVSNYKMLRPNASPAELAAVRKLEMHASYQQKNAPQYINQLKDKYGQTKTSRTELEGIKKNPFENISKQFENFVNTIKKVLRSLFAAFENTSRGLAIADSFATLSNVFENFNKQMLRYGEELQEVFNNISLAFDFVIGMFMEKNAHVDKLVQKAERFYVNFQRTKKGVADPSEGLPSGVKVTENNLVSKNRSYSFQSKSGKEVGVYFSHKKNMSDVHFDIDKSMSTKVNDMSQKEKDAIALKVLKIMKHDAKSRKEGYRYKTSAYTGDDYGAVRSEAYEQIAGFSRPVAGKVGGYQFAVVQGGKLTPDNKKLEQQEYIHDHSPDDVSQNLAQFKELLAIQRQAAKAAAANNRANKGLSVANGRGLDEAYENFEKFVNKVNDKAEELIKATFTPELKQRRVIESAEAIKSSAPTGKAAMPAADKEFSTYLSAGFSGMQGFNPQVYEKMAGVLGEKHNFVPITNEEYDTDATVFDDLPVFLKSALERITAGGMKGINPAAAKMAQRAYEDYQLDPSKKIRFAGYSAGAHVASDALEIFKQLAPNADARAVGIGGAPFDQRRSTLRPEQYVNMLRKDDLLLRAFAGAFKMNGANQRIIEPSVNKGAIKALDAHFIEGYADDQNTARELKYLIEASESEIQAFLSSVADSSSVLSVFADNAGAYKGTAEEIIKQLDNLASALEQKTAQIQPRMQQRGQASLNSVMQSGMGAFNNTLSNAQGLRQTPAQMQRLMAEARKRAMQSAAATGIREGQGILNSGINKTSSLAETFRQPGVKVIQAYGEDRKAQVRASSAQAIASVANATEAVSNSISEAARVLAEKAQNTNNDALKLLYNELSLNTPVLEAIAQRTGQKVETIIQNIASEAENSINEKTQQLSSGYQGGIDAVQEGGEQAKGFVNVVAGLSQRATTDPIGAFNEAKALLAGKILDDLKARFPIFGEIQRRFGMITGAASALVGAFVGFAVLKGVMLFFEKIGFAAIEVATRFENLERIIRFTSGSATEAAQNISFVQGLSDKFALNPEKAMSGFAQMSAAALETPLQGEGVKKIQSSISQASAVYGLAPESQERVFVALNQMISKGTVSSEELRQQLGESLPGALNIAARSMGVTTSEFNKMLEQGQVLSEDFLPKFAAQLAAETEGGVAGAATSAQAKINRFNNAILTSQNILGKGLMPVKNFGLDVLTGLLTGLTKILPVVAHLMGSLLFASVLQLGKSFYMLAANPMVRGAVWGGLKGAIGGLITIIKSLSGYISQFAKAFLVFTAITEGYKMFKAATADGGGESRTYADKLTEGLGKYRKALADARGETEALKKSTRPETLLDATFLGNLMPKEIEENDSLAKKAGYYAGKFTSTGLLNEDQIEGMSKNALGRTALQWGLGGITGAQKGFGLATFEEKKFADQQVATGDIRSAANETTSQIISAIPGKELAALKEYDRKLRDIQIKRRGISETQPQNKEALRKLKEEEAQILKNRDAAQKPISALQAQAQSSVDALKAEVEKYEKLALEPGKNQAYYKETLAGLKGDLEAAYKFQDKLNQSVGEAVNAFILLQRQLQNVADRLADANDRIQMIANSAKADLFGRTDLTPGQREAGQQEIEQAALGEQIKQRQSAIQQYQVLLEDADSQKILEARGITNVDAIGQAELGTLAGKAKDGTQEKEVLTRLQDVKRLKLETQDLTAQLAQSQAATRDRIYDANKQIIDYFREVSRQSAELALSTKEAGAQIAMQEQKNKLKSALQGFQDNFFSSFVDSLIEGVDSLNEPIAAAIEREREVQSAKFAKDDRDRQAYELQRSLPLAGAEVKLDFGALDSAPVKELEKTLQKSAEASKQVTAASKETGAAIADSSKQAGNLNTNVTKVAEDTKETKAATDNVTTALKENVEAAQKVGGQVYLNTQEVDANTLAIGGTNDALGNQSDALAGLGGQLLEQGGLIDGINSIWNTVSGTIAGAAARTWDWFKGLVANTPILSGIMETLDGWAKSIQNAIAKAWEFFKGLADNVPFLRSIADAVGAIGSGIGGAVQNGMQAIGIGREQINTGKGVGVVGKYTIVESVGGAIQNVNTFRDLEKHHPSRGREAGRSYGHVDGEFEEIRNTRDGRTLVKKDFVLSKNGNQNVDIPAMASGFVKVLGDATNTVQIYADKEMTKLLGQSLHQRSVAVKTGQFVNYGQSLGIQGDRGSPGAIHAHIELEKSRFEQYIKDLKDGTFEGVNGGVSTALDGAGGSVVKLGQTMVQELAHYPGDGHNHGGFDGKQSQAERSNLQGAGNILRGGNFNPFAGGSNSFAARVVGHSEGNRTATGGFNRGYRGHGDPGNGQRNVGSFSVQTGTHGNMSAEQADVYWQKKLAAVLPQFQTAARGAGLDPNNPKLLANFLDLHTQSPAAATDKGHRNFLSQLPAIAKAGMSDESILQARMSGYYRNNGRANFPGFGNDPNRLRRDQMRRMAALQAALPGAIQATGAPAGSSGVVASGAAPAAQQNLPVLAPVPFASMSSTSVDTAPLSAAQAESERIRREQERQAIAKERARNEEARVQGEQRQRQRLEQLRQSIRDTEGDRIQTNRQFTNLGLDAQIQTPDVESSRKILGVNETYDDLERDIAEKVRKATAGRDQARATLQKLSSPDYVPQPGQDVGRDIEATRTAITQAEKYLGDLTRIQGELKGQRQERIRFEEEQAAREKKLREQQERFATEEISISVLEAEAQRLKDLRGRGVRDQGTENLPKLEATIAARREELQLQQKLSEIDENARKNGTDPKVVAEQKAGLQDRLKIVRQTIEANREYAETVEGRENSKRAREQSIELSRGELAVMKQQLEAAEAIAQVNPLAPEALGIPEMQKAIALKEAELTLTEQIAGIEDKRFTNDMTDEAADKRIADLRKENEQLVENINKRAERATKEQEFARRRAALDNRNQDVELKGSVTEALARNIELGRSTGEPIAMRFEQQRSQQQLSFDRQMLDLDELEASGKRTKEEIAALRAEYTRLNEVSLDNLKAEQQRATEDRIMEISGRMTSSRVGVLNGRADLLSSMGLDTQSKSYRRQAAISDQQQNYSQQSLELERFIAQQQLSNEQALELRTSLSEVNNMSMEKINNEFSTWNELMVGVQGSFESAFTSILDGSKTIGEAAMDFLKGIGSQLASMASKMLVDKLFGGLFGKGNEDQEAKKAGLISQGGIIGEMTGGNPLAQYSALNPLPVSLVNTSALAGLGGFGGGGANLFQKSSGGGIFDVFKGSGSLFGSANQFQNPVAVNMVGASNNVFEPITKGIGGVFSSLMGGGAGGGLGGIVGSLLGGLGGGGAAGGGMGGGFGSLISTGLSLVSSIFGFHNGGIVGDAAHVQAYASGGVVSGCGCRACSFAQGGTVGSGIEESLEAAMKRERSMNGGKRARVIIATDGELIVPNKIVNRLNDRQKAFLIGKSSAPSASMMNYATGGIVGSQMGSSIANNVTNMGGSTKIEGSTVNVGEGGNMSRSEAAQLKQMIDASVMQTISKQTRPRGLLSR